MKDNEVQQARILGDLIVIHAHGLNHIQQRSLAQLCMDFIKRMNKASATMKRVSKATGVVFIDGGCRLNLGHSSVKA